jgi:hypothetical protein
VSNILLTHKFTPIMSKEVKTMATAVHPVPELLTLEQYLQTSYRPDRDFVDGVTEERNVGESEHSDFQSELIYWFRVHRQEWNIRVNQLRPAASLYLGEMPRDVQAVAGPGVATRASFANRDKRPDLENDAPGGTVTLQQLISSARAPWFP